MATNAMSSAELANWIPEYQSAKALAALEKKLVLKPTVWAEYRDDLPWGDTVNIAITPDLGAANTVATNTDLTLDNRTTAKKSIAVNQWNYKAVGVGYKDKMQNRPDYLTNIAAKCVYSCAKRMDYFLATLFPSFEAGNVGTAGSSLTDDVILSAVELLNLADGDEDYRYLTVDVESITDMFKIDKILRDDYVAKGRVESSKGFVGRSTYGCTVYMSNNLMVHDTTTYHWAGLYQKEAIAYIIQKNDIVDMFDWKEKFTNVVRAQTIFGANLTRPEVGVLINTRS